ncbi:hypothetical protein [Halalkalibacter nanhaiisediminis]|uniref:Lipoprotein n=1 Tax=Halalkalibacter nanhaiisediminis TaxID=688079 RepID=A0A562QMC2_9BACI|nr:hypothetical protein [Halalkalibacter nanhaiisediminis]TWI57902.1 hypothetical protein IQ10_01231 [Halalkalibacter nanhaiisediminis]
MKNVMILMVSFVFVFVLLTGCETLSSSSFSTDSRAFSEMPLSENEQLIFSMLADQIFYLQFVDRNKEFRSMEVGLDYYYYGELTESVGGMKIGANDPEIEGEKERSRVLFTFNKEESKGQSLISGEMKVMDDGGSGHSPYSFSHPGGMESVSSTHGYLFDRLEGDVPYGEKIYVAYHVENNESNSMRSFDMNIALQPNDDFEHLYAYYVIIDDEAL